MESKSLQVSEKEISAPVSSSEELREANEAAVVIPERDLKRAIWTIVYGVALPCIPIIVICAVLLYIIFHHRLKLNPGLSVLQVQHKTGATEQNLTTLVSDYAKFRKQGGEWAYYVRFNPSTITTIASWTSRIIPYLQSSIMALVAFFAARHIVQKSKHGDESKLPNPEQLSLLISTLSGNGFGPLKDVFLYRFTKRGRLIHPLPAAVSAFTIITVLALIIPIIDTWFGVATTAETVTQLVPNNSTLNYGRGISTQTCPSGPADNNYANQQLQNKTAFWPCNVVIAIHADQRFVPGLAEAGNIAIDASNSTRLRNYTDVTGNTFWYLGSPTQNSLQDYHAKTLAVTAQCQPMTLKQCNITYPEAQESGRFECNDNFVGSLGLEQLNTSATGSENANAINVGLAFSGNAALTDVTGKISSGSDFGGFATDPEMYRTNPLYYGAWAFGFPAPDILSTGSFQGDSAYYYNMNSGGLWMLNCSTAVYDVTYTWINGVVGSFNTSLASTDTAALLTGPFVVGSSPYVQNSLNTIAATAGAANYSVGIANTFATEYSKLLLAYSVGALEPQLVLAEQDRSVIANVARVPLIPLYLLLTTKAIYVLAVIILAIAAYAFTHPAETEIVKDQLTVKGLTTAHFNRPDVMQEYALNQLKSNIDATNGTSTGPPQGSTSKEIEEAPNPVLRHAATAPPESPPKPLEAKVGLMPAVDGTWQFVVKADGVWNSVKPFVKPIVQQVLMGEAQAGALGDAGAVINAYHGK